MAFPGFTTYCCSKGGMRMMMRNLAVELGPLGITINNIAPGAIVTPINKALLDDKPKLDALLAKFPWAAWARPTMSPDWSPSSPPTKHPMSPARPSSSTAA